MTTSPTTTAALKELARRLRFRSDQFQSLHGNYLYYGGGDSILDCAAADAIAAALAQAGAEEAMPKLSKPDGAYSNIGKLDDEVERVGWAILQALHEHIDEAERPMSWSDMSGDQEQRIRAAAVAAIEAFNQPALSANPILKADLLDDILRLVDQCTGQFGMPAGWRLVPIEPTPDMRIAGGIAWTEALPKAVTCVDAADACYRAMLTASPAPPAQGREGK